MTSIEAEPGQRPERPFGQHGQPNRPDRPERPKRPERRRGRGRPGVVDVDTEHPDIGDVIRDLIDIAIANGGEVPVQDRRLGRRQTARLVISERRPGRNRPQRGRPPGPGPSRMRALIWVVILSGAMLLLLVH